jgi:hypothetical protein
MTNILKIDVIYSYLNIVYTHYTAPVYSVHPHLSSSYFQKSCSLYATFFIDILQTLATLMSSIPLTAKGPAQICIFDIHVFVSPVKVCTVSIMPLMLFNYDGFLHSICNIYTTFFELNG